MGNMFYGAMAFNQPVEGWNTANVMDMYATFSYAASFNQPVEAWNTANVTDMRYIFYGASVFTQHPSWLH